ncbi:MAG: AmmeMemoRadiSam system protein B [archaeon]
MRLPIVSGQFYAKDKDKLVEQIETCFKNSEFGPGKLPEREKKAIGIITPHAGYIYSGFCAAHGFTKIGQPEIAILLGTSHIDHPSEKFAVSLEDFQTPIGVAENDIELTRSLISQEHNCEQNEVIHKFEHSIETQIPFLQYVSPKTKIVPIIVLTKDLGEIKKFSEFLVEKIKGKDIVIIASSDLTHYGTGYGFTPFLENERENLHKLDESIIRPILEFNILDFFEKASESTVCGILPIILAINTCQKLGSTKAELLKYYSSGDILKDYKNTVGYACISFN